MAEQLRKHVPMLDKESIKALEVALENNSPDAEEKLVALYYHTNSVVEMLLIEQLCKAKGYKLEVEDDTPPLQYA